MPDAYICDGIRTPFGRFGGALARVRSDDLAALAIRSLLERHKGLEGSAIDEVVLGCSNQAGEDSRNVARMAVLLSGLPDTVPGITVNRLCASGLEAVAYAARTIKTGEADLVVAGGVESMTRAPLVMGKAEAAFARSAKIEDSTIGWRFVNPKMQAAYGIDSMPETAENIAKEFGISRQKQDEFALRSQQRTAAARNCGFFSDEIIPVSIPDGKSAPIVVQEDEHPRPDTSLEALASLKPIVTRDGTVTAGNAAGINDGAVALLLASEDAVRKHNLRPRVRIDGYSTAGVAPRLMGIGPVPAIKKLLTKANVMLAKLDLIEVNEAFAAQVLAVLQQLGLPHDSQLVNPYGGSIAIGHPLGASGARLALTAMRGLEARCGKHALVSLCVGVGQGAAMLMSKV